MSRLRVLDLFSGAGGFSEGFRQAGFDVVAGIDNWAPAVETHHLNGLGAGLNYDLLSLVDNNGFETAQNLVREIEKRYGRIDVLIGSPPCQQFSLANRGGSGDVKRGMLLVRSFLVMVAAMKPRFWLMENVPRLEAAILAECESTNRGWEMPLRTLGLDDDGVLNIPYGRIYSASQYGAPQNRKRFVVGNIDSNIIIAQQRPYMPIFGRMIERLEEQWLSGADMIDDPNYEGHTIERSNLRDYDYGTDIHPLYWEEMRFFKRRHYAAGKLAYPDNLENPARTIVATVQSREPITIDTGKSVTYHGKKRPIYRLLKMREAACVQGFPLDFQFVGNNLTTRYKLIGNAVPCQLAYALANSVLFSFERHGAESDDQYERFQATDLMRSEFMGNPIIIPRTQIPPEADNLHDHKTMRFSARPDKAFRRYLLVSKVANHSARVIFENSFWDEGGKRRGEAWKSCIQSGTGRIFSQVFIDDVSVSMMLRVMNHDLIYSDKGQMFLDDEGMTNRLVMIKDIVARIQSEMSQGLPLVGTYWEEFPGIGSGDISKYFCGEDFRKLGIPSATRFQELFTAEHIETNGVIGPLDFFDGLDALILYVLARDDVISWASDINLVFDELVDRGDAFHGRRISSKAQNYIKRRIPLVTIISALASILILDIMHKQDVAHRDPIIEAIAKAASLIDEWTAKSENHLE